MAGVLVAGIDVGGATKGFHAVLLGGGTIVGDGLFRSRTPEAVAAWCRERGALVVGVDAPCRFRAVGGEARLAERELLRGGLSCFLTPSKERAACEPSGFYGWMLNGALLYDELERFYPLFTGGAWRAGSPVCFETFPHAIACALAARRLPASEKRAARRRVLSEAGVDLLRLTNQDFLDAALCALAARCLASGSFRSYGEAATGLVVIPELA